MRLIASGQRIEAQRSAATRGEASWGAHGTQRLNRGRQWNDRRWCSSRKHRWLSTPPARQPRQRRRTRNVPNQSIDRELLWCRLVLLELPTANATGIERGAYSGDFVQQLSILPPLHARSTPTRDQSTPPSTTRLRCCRGDLPPLRIPPRQLTFHVSVTSTSATTGPLCCRG